MGYPLPIRVCGLKAFGEKVYTAGRRHLLAKAGPGCWVVGLMDPHLKCRTCYQVEAHGEEDAIAKVRELEGRYGPKARKE